MEEKPKVDVDAAYETIVREVYCPAFFDRLTEHIPELGDYVSSSKLGDQQLADAVGRVREENSLPQYYDAPTMEEAVNLLVDSKLTEAIRSLVDREST